jgi:hypothetical protein
VIGARDFTYLRIAVFHVGAIRLISLFLPKLLGHPRVPPKWTPRIRLVANFLNKNLYQVLFFVLPIYYASATLSSGNFLFVVLVALSRLATVDIGTDFQRTEMQVGSPLTELPPARALWLYGLTAIKAPMGLKERVRHRWYINGKLIWDSPFHIIIGGREAGFRFWTHCYFDSIPPRAKLRLDVETEGGQLIGRARLW